MMSDPVEVTVRMGSVRYQGVPDHFEDFDVSKKYADTYVIAIVNRQKVGSL